MEKEIFLFYFFRKILWLKMEKNKEKKKVPRKKKRGGGRVAPDNLFFFSLLKKLLALAFCSWRRVASDNYKCPCGERVAPDNFLTSKEKNRPCGSHLVLSLSTNIIRL